MAGYLQTLESLKASPRKWLVTGVAGFIGSHLLETLLGCGQKVIGLDDFTTGSRANLDEVKRRVAADAWERFTLIDGSISDVATCREAVRGVDYVLHHAAFVSVPLSIENPDECHRINVEGFRNMLAAAADGNVKRLIYASTSAVYGDDPETLKVEEKIGRPLSPYAASKQTNEEDARRFQLEKGLEALGLRYFNIFGPRQNPSGGYAAVIPTWIMTLAKNEPCFINGSGEITRDFCHVSNVAQANILAAVSGRRPAHGEAFNVAQGKCYTLFQLHELIVSKFRARYLAVPAESPVFHPPRPGDIVHSAADIAKIRRELGFEPAMALEEGLEDTVDWYLRKL